MKRPQTVGVYVVAGTRFENRDGGADRITFSVPDGDETTARKEAHSLVKQNGLKAPTCVELLDNNRFREIRL